MQELRDIFGIWDNKIPEMAADIGEKYDTVLKWRKHGRIPETAWASVISAAAVRGYSLTADDFHRLNRKPKQRGWPAHKARFRAHKMRANA